VESNKHSELPLSLHEDLRVCTRRSVGIASPTDGDYLESQIKDLSVNILMVLFQLHFWNTEDSKDAFEQSRACATL